MMKLPKNRILRVIVLVFAIGIASTVIYQIEVIFINSIVDILTSDQSQDTAIEEASSQDDPDDDGVIVAEVSGESMEPAIMDGELVYEDTKNKYPQFHDIIAVEVDDAIFLKRVIGMPGDTIDIHDGDVYINGEEEEFLTDLEVWGTFTQVPVTLAEDEYFVLGDNREHSYDSRNFGPVKRDQIVGVYLEKV